MAYIKILHFGQQYSSAILILLCFHSHKEKNQCAFQNIIFSMSCYSLKMHNAEILLTWHHINSGVSVLNTIQMKCWPHLPNKKKFKKFTVFSVKMTEKHSSMPHVLATVIYQFRNCELWWGQWVGKGQESCLNCIKTCQPKKELNGRLLWTL